MWPSNSTRACYRTLFKQPNNHDRYSSDLKWPDTRYCRRFSGSVLVASLCPLVVIQVHRRNKAHYASSYLSNEDNNDSCLMSHRPGTRIEPFPRSVGQRLPYSGIYDKEHGYYSKYKSLFVDRCYLQPITWKWWLSKSTNKAMKKFFLNAIKEQYHSFFSKSEDWKTVEPD